MTHSDRGTFELIADAALEVLRERVRATDPGPYREALVKIGTDLRASRRTGQDILTADLACACAAIEAAPEDVRERCEALVERAETDAIRRGYGTQALAEEMDTARECAAFWWCGWTSVFDEACAEVGYPKRYGFVFLAEARAAAWNPEAVAA